MIFRSFFAAACCMVVAGSAFAAERRGGTEADYAAIQAFHDASITKFNAGDLEGSLADYVRSCEFCTPNPQRSPVARTCAPVGRSHSRQALRN
jgi:hypothetical protein